MRARTIVFSGLGLSLAAASFLFACGGTEETPAPVDAGKDVTVDAPQDVAPDNAVVDAGCAVDGSLNTLTPPDAAIGDSGATLPGCATCLKTKCSSDINACDQLCECKEAVFGVYDCLGKGKGFQTCAVTNFVGAGQETQTIGLSLGQCAGTNCSVQCGLSALLDGGFQLDSGIKDASGQ